MAKRRTSELKVSLTVTLKVDSDHPGVGTLSADFDVDGPSSVTKLFADAIDRGDLAAGANAFVDSVSGVLQGRRPIPPHFSPASSGNA